MKSGRNSPHFKREIRTPMEHFLVIPYAGRDASETGGNNTEYELVDHGFETSIYPNPAKAQHHALEPQFEAVTQQKGFAVMPLVRNEN